MMRACVLIALAFVAVGALPFEASIGAPSSRLSNDFPYLVTFSLTNTAPEPITVCIWGTPLDKSSDVLRADMFEIVNELGVSAVYTGIVMKRKPTVSDFITLQPNQTVSAQVDLLKGYWFPQEGKYFVSLKSYIYIHTGIELCLKRLSNQGLVDFTTYDLISADILPLDVLDTIRAPHWGEPNLLGGVSIQNCTSTEQSGVNTANTNSVTLINQVNTYLTKACSSAPTYVTWFGACDNNRYSTVISHFKNILSRNSAGYRVDCKGPSCSANTFAYVYPTDTTYTVYVCGAFQSASVNTCSYDSKPGTLIHELSHFNSVAGTKDNAYGTTACRNLATSNPASAVNNADSHEYMAESCPKF